MRTRNQTTRRDFLKMAGTGMLGLLTAGMVSAREDSGRKPNVLFLFTDDQRFDTIHALGNDVISTPNMDALAGRGTTFTNAYIMGSMSGAVCMPSRAMLMTGRTLFRLKDDGKTVPPKIPTLPETLRKAGYATFETGKWHQDRAAFARSFSAADKVFFGGMSDHYKVPVYDYDPEGTYPNQNVQTVEGRHSSDLFSDAAVEFLRSYTGDDPFFMYVSFTAPHDPREMPEEYLKMYDPATIPLPESFLPEHPFDNGELDIRDERLAPWPRTPAEIRKHIAAYYAMITHVDARIGLILDTLREKGLADDTIIVFAGDNGLAVGRHGLLGKQNLYEHSIHVPLILAGPGIPAGESRDDFCYLSDIFPTLCDLAGTAIPATVEGKSLVPALGEGNEAIRESLFFAYKHFQRAVRTERWKLILYNVKGVRTTQLFDLANDPHEITNLAGDPERSYLVRGLTSLMKDWIEKTGDPVDLDKPDWGVETIPSWQERRKQSEAR